MKRICKFCRCTDKRPCLLTEVTEYADSFILDDGFQLIPDGAKTRLITCSWLMPDICTAPSCVEKAYREAVLEAEALLLALGAELPDREWGVAC